MLGRRCAGVSGGVLRYFLNFGFLEAWCDIGFRILGLGVCRFDPVRLLRGGVVGGGCCL